MKTSSAKAKGRKLQNWVRDKMLYQSEGTLTSQDVRSTTMGAPGEDILLSTIAREVYPFTFECKNQERVNLWDAWRQTQYHAEELKVDGCVVVSRNRQKPLAVLDAEVFIEMCDTLYNYRRSPHG